MRHFTPKEINYILKDITNLFPNFVTMEQKTIYTGKIISYMKTTLEKEKINDPFDIDALKKEIENHVIKSIIEPGEGVGVICAQSIGERQTQLCISYDEHVIIFKNEKMIIDKIGKIVDDLMGDRNVSHLPLFDQHIKVPFVDQEGNVDLINLIEVSRYKHFGDLIEIITETGRRVITTGSHAHLQLYNGKLIPKKASDLRAGDRIPVLKKRNWAIPDIKNIVHNEITALRYNRMGMVYNMKTRKLMDDSDLILFGDVFLDRISVI
jgi:hypothetical protein